MQLNGSPDDSEFELTYRAVLRSLEADGSMDAGHLAGLRQKIGAMAEVLGQFRQQRKKLGDSGRFTMAGLMDAERELAVKFAGELRRLGDTARLRDNIKQHEAKLTPAPKGNDTQQLLVYWRLMEVRGYLGQAIASDPLQAEAIYRAALAEGQHEILEALETWPIKSPVSAELIAEGQQLRMEARDPALAAQLRSLRTLQQIIESAVKDAISELPLGQDALQQLASGEATTSEGR
jgi:hypothetical protein